MTDKFLLHAKMEMIFIFASVFQGVVSYVESRLFNDWMFLEGLITLLILNLGLSLYRKRKEPAKEKTEVLKDFLELFILYVCGLVATNVLVKARIGGVDVGLFDYLDNFLLSAMLAAEGVKCYTLIVKVRPDMQGIFNKVKSLIKHNDGKI